MGGPILPYCEEEPGEFNLSRLQQSLWTPTVSALPQLMISSLFFGCLSTVHSLFVMEITSLGTVTSSCKTEYQECNGDTQPQHINRYKKGKKQAVLLWPCCLPSCTAVCMWIWEIFVMPFSKYCSRQSWWVYHLWISSTHPPWNDVFSSHWRAFKRKIFYLCKQLLRREKECMGFDFKQINLRV